MAQLSRLRSSGQIMSLAAVLWTALFAGGPGWGESFSVENELDLHNAIAEANDGDTITVNASLTLTRALPNITANVTITGANEEPDQRLSIDGDQKYPMFFVESGTVTLSNLRIVNGYTKGGDGADGGGGGLGAGAGLFVNAEAAVIVEKVEFTGNVAQGGDGGTYSSGAAGGGGGGMTGDGGANGGGGGGFCGDGESGQGGYGGCLADNAAQPEGGGRDGTTFEGGGGGHVRHDGQVVDGGNGGDFGGGGGSTAGNGGDGGWGGGGGGSTAGEGGDGGFGGGDGASSGQGNGGSAFGGAVFVREGGTLTIRDSDFVDGSTPNQVLAGLGAENGSAAGAAIYIDDGVDLMYEVTTGEESTVEQSIGGDGDLTKTGEGILILNGPNNYTGNTTIEAGELKGTMQGLQYDSEEKVFQVEADATLTLAHTSAGSFEFKPQITGGGRLRKEGDNTVTLTGQNDYSGGTEVLEGVLVGTTQSIPSDGDVSIASDATLQLNEPGSSEYSGGIDGSGTFQKGGSGTLSLSKDNSGFLGSTEVLAGTLRLLSDASLGGDVDVYVGATLEGTGRVGNDLRLRGNLAPGVDSFGTLEVGGSAAFEEGSVFEVDLDDDDTDMVEVTGAAYVELGALLSVRPEDGDYAPAGGSTFSVTILTAALGVSGETVPEEGFFTIVEEFCGLEPGVTADATEIRLTLKTTGVSPFHRCAVTPNQNAVAGALDAIPSSETPQDIYRTARRLTPPEVQAALDSMSGEAFAAFSTTRLANGARFMRTLSQRLRDSGSEASAGPPYPLGGGAAPGRAGIYGFAPLGPSVFGFGASHLHSVGTPPKPGDSPFTFVSMRGESGLGGWLDASVLYGDVEGDSNSTDTEFTVYGTAGGIDYRLTDNLLLGVSAAWSRTNLSASSINSWGHHYTYQGAVYGNLTTDPFYLGMIASYGRSRFDTERALSFGSFYERPKAKFSGQEISGYAELGLAAFDLAGVQLQPVASFLYSHLEQDGFTESRGEELDPGDDSLRLTVEGQTINSRIGSVGLRLYQIFEMKQRYQIIPELRARYAYEFGKTDRHVHAYFADFPTGSPPQAFTVRGAETGRHTADIGLGWSVVVNEFATMYFNYDANVARDLFAHSFAVGCLVRW